MQFINSLYEFHFANHLVTEWGNVINKRNNKLVPSPFCPSISKPTQKSSILYLIRLLPFDSFNPTFLHPKQKGRNPKNFFKTKKIKKSCTLSFYVFLYLAISLHKTKISQQRKERNSLSLASLPFIFFNVLPRFSMHFSIQKKGGKTHRNTNKQKIKMCCTFSFTHPPYVFLGLLPFVSFYFTHYPSKKKKGQKNLLHPLPHLLSFFFTLSFSHTFSLH